MEATTSKRHRLRPMDPVRDFADEMLVYNREVQVPGTKMSFYEYYNSLPRCAVCHEIGYHPSHRRKNQPKKGEQLTQKQEQQIYHAYELGYLLYKCGSCGVLVHSQCYGNKFNFPAVDEECPKTDILWSCHHCKRPNKPSGPPRCDICEQSYELPQVFKSVKGSAAGQMHLFCAMWATGYTALDLSK